MQIAASRRRYVIIGREGYVHNPTKIILTATLLFETKHRILETDINIGDHIMLYI
jgi:hypothetical protein